MCDGDYEVTCHRFRRALPADGYQPCDCGRTPAPGELVMLVDGTSPKPGVCPAAAGRSAHDPPAEPDHDYHSCDWGQRVTHHRWTVCEHCTTAARVLEHWCDNAPAVNQIPDQIANHVHCADENTFPAAVELAALATNQWNEPKPNGLPVPLRAIQALVNHITHPQPAPPGQPTTVCDGQLDLFANTSKATP